MSLESLLKQARLNGADIPCPRHGCRQAGSLPHREAVRRHPDCGLRFVRCGKAAARHDDVGKVFRDQGAKFVTEAGRSNGTRPAVLSVPSAESEAVPAPPRAAAPQRSTVDGLSATDRKTLQSALSTLKEAQAALKSLKSS